MQNGNKEIVNLGWMNGWYNGNPAEYDEHCRLVFEEGEKHETGGFSVGRCATTTVCYTCGIKWSVDSGD